MRAGAERSALGVLVGFLLAPAPGCRGLSDVEIRYEDCVQPKMPYAERFGDGFRVLPERCWKPVNVDDGDLSIDDSDLVVASSEPSSWDGNPPMLARELEGDFVVVVKTEATSGTRSDFCNLRREGGYDASGIIVSGVDGVRAAFLVRPFLEEEPAPSCLDEAPSPPRAVAFAPSNAPAVSQRQSDGFGFDGEGDIAVCRNGRYLAYYYRAPESADYEAPWRPGEWKRLGDVDEVGDGPLEVGLASTMHEASVELGIQGHFNWVYVAAFGGDCVSPLEDMKKPEPD